MLARFVQAAKRTKAASTSTPSAKAFAGVPTVFPIRPGLVTLKCRSPFTSGNCRAISAATAFRSASAWVGETFGLSRPRSEEHTSELQSHSDLVCRLLLEKKKKNEHRLQSYKY